MERYRNGETLAETQKKRKGKTLTTIEIFICSCSNDLWFFGRPQEQILNKTFPTARSTHQALLKDGTSKKKTQAGDRRFNPERQKINSFSCFLECRMSVQFPRSLTTEINLMRLKTLWIISYHPQYRDFTSNPSRYSDHTFL